MPTAELAINKLIILSILARLPGITLSQLTSLSLETLYMDYFNFVSAFDELCRDHLATVSVDKGEIARDGSGKPVPRCYPTEEGHRIQLTLEQRIPLPIRSYLAQAAAGWQRDSRRKSERTAVCEPDGNGFYRVLLSHHDGIRTITELKLSLPDRTIGQVICERWLRHPQTLYLGLLSLLTGETLPAEEQPPEPRPDMRDEPEQIKADSFAGARQQSFLPDDPEGRP